jgi:hypothetical protein
MNTRKIMGTIILVVGIVLLIISAAADVIGIGKNPTFGYAQDAGVVAGVVVAIAGLALLLKKPKPVSNS